MLRFGILCVGEGKNLALVGCCHRSQVPNLFGNCSLISAELDSATGCWEQTCVKDAKIGQNLALKSYFWKPFFQLLQKASFFSCLFCSARNKFLFIQSSRSVSAFLTTTTT